jgi:hypothetical protein
MAQAPVVALINPDAALVDGSLAILADVALGFERLLAARVLYPDGSRQDSAHPIPGSRGDLARSLLPPDLLPGRLDLGLRAVAAGVETWSWPSATVVRHRTQAVMFRSRGALKRALGRSAERERRQLDALSEVRRTTP